MKKKLMGIFSVLLCVLLAACGSTETEETSQAAAAEEDQKEETEATSQFPRTIQHVKGEFELEKKPDRIASVDIMITDYLLVLDEAPIMSEGISTKERSDIFAKYAEGKDIADLGGHVNLETIVANAPDVMLMSSESKKVDKYDDFNNLAPTIVIDFSKGVRSRLTQIAEIVGKEDKAKELIAEFDKQVEEASVVAAEHKNETILFLISNGKDFTVMNPKDFPVYYDEIGLTAPGGLPEEKNGRIGVEALTKINPDHIFIAENRRQMNADDKNGLIHIWNDNPVWQGLHAVENNQVYTMDTLASDTFFLGQIAGVEAVIQNLGK
ncbi:ABC transporter substrate-binding protein [Pseudalkalibacillus decolorationis]|uniref:ABC transporter substrate-binding protein n=1 Tax=Pseudalkalibacillus decolorationis TaxID=163879 RepID=UPI0021477C2E|nr:ABC transporter substrate-binding protein [Pseudalkalibacillus decolorationis]